MTRGLEHNRRKRRLNYLREAKRDITDNITIEYPECDPGDVFYVGDSMTTAYDERHKYFAVAADATVMLMPGTIPLPAYDELTTHPCIGMPVTYYHDRKVVIGHVIKAAKTLHHGMVWICQFSKAGQALSHTNVFCWPTAPVSIDTDRTEVRPNTHMVTLDNVTVLSLHTTPLRPGCRAYFNTEHLKLSTMIPKTPSSYMSDSDFQMHEQLIAKALETAKPLHDARHTMKPEQIQHELSKGYNDMSHDELIRIRDEMRSGRAQAGGSTQGFAASGQAGISQESRQQLDRINAENEESGTAIDPAIKVIYNAADALQHMGSQYGPHTSTMAFHAAAANPNDLTEGLKQFQALVQKERGRSAADQMSAGMLDKMNFAQQTMPRRSATDVGTLNSRAQHVRDRQAAEKILRDQREAAEQQKRIQEQLVIIQREEEMKAKQNAFLAKQEEERRLFMMSESGAANRMAAGTSVQEQQELMAKLKAYEDRDKQKSEIQTMKEKLDAYKQQEAMAADFRQQQRQQQTQEVPATTPAAAATTPSQPTAAQMQAEAEARAAAAAPMDLDDEPIDTSAADAAALEKAQSSRKRNSTKAKFSAGGDDEYGSRKERRIITTMPSQQDRIEWAKSMQSRMGIDTFDNPHADYMSEMHANIAHGNGRGRPLKY